MLKLNAATTDDNQNLPTLTPNIPNNFSLEFDSDSIAVFLWETIEQVVVATLRATDTGDRGTLADIIYTIASVNSVSSEGMSSNTHDIFQIDSSTGTLTASDLDAEAYTHHTLIIRASDRDIPVRSALITVTVNVTDVNDNAPTFIGTPYVAVQEENSPVPSIVVIITARDDADVTAPNNILQGYNIENYQDMFRIYSNGTIETIAPLDAETQAEYFINVSAVDGGIPPLTSYTTVHLRVTDVDDNPAFVNQVEPAYCAWWPHLNRSNDIYR